MNTNLTQVIIETIEESKAVLGEGFDLAKEQTPLVIQEFLMWKFVESLFYAVLCVVIIAALVYIARRIVNWLRPLDVGEWELLEIGGFLGLVMSLLICIPIFCAGIETTKDAIQIKVAPRVYLIEWVADTVKGK